jgi:hypothetical protein
MSIDLGTLTLGHFEPLVGRDVTMLVHPDGAFAQVAYEFTAHVLSATVSRYEGMKGATRRAFSVHLTVPEPFGLDGGYFLLRHPELGDLGPLWIQCAAHPDKTKAHLNLILG